MRKILFLSAVLISGVAYSAPPTDFMGLTIGASFNLPECSWNGTGALATYDYWFNQSVKPCWEHNILESHPGDPLDTTGTFKVNFLPAKQYSPSGVDPDSVSVIVVNGKISGMTALTGGYKVQDDLLQLLSEKYGKPTKETTSQVHNAMGAKFSDVNAKWIKPDVIIEFAGIVSQIDSGVITILNPAALQFEANEEEKRKENSGSF